VASSDVFGGFDLRETIRIGQVYKKANTYLSAASAAPRPEQVIHSCVIVVKGTFEDKVEVLGGKDQGDRVRHGIDDPFDLSEELGSPELRRVARHSY